MYRINGVHSGSTEPTAQSNQKHITLVNVKKVPINLNKINNTLL